jgi:hypothetical protein
MSTTPVTGQFICVAKKEWIPIVADNDELPISNLGALRMGLEALQMEDARDRVRAKELWDDAKMLLATENDDDTGAGAEGIVNLSDDWDMQSVGNLEWGWRGAGWHGR